MFSLLVGRQGPEQNVGTVGEENNTHPHTISAHTRIKNLRSGTGF